MNIDIDFFALVLNAVATCICGSVILYNISVGRCKRAPFYYTWFLGFLLYGIQIALRAYSLSVFMEIILMLLAFVFFLTGMWSLVRSKKFLYLISIICFSEVTVMISFFWGIIKVSELIFFGANLMFLPVLISILYHRVVFGRVVDKLAFGWFLLYLSNILLWGRGWIIDTFAIFAKFILLLGIIDYDFIIVMEKIRSERGSILPSVSTGAEKEGGLKLLTFSPDHVKKVEWIIKRVKENLKRDENTYIFSFQDVIPHRELRRIEWIAPERIFVFLFSASAEKAKEEFTVFPMDITKIGASLAEVIKKHLKIEKGGTAIFMDLSLLIHVFGVYPVYNMLLNKMGSLREGGINLLAFFHPETHNKSVVSLFTNISDEVIKL